MTGAPFCASGVRHTRGALRDSVPGPTGTADSALSASVVAGGSKEMRTLPSTASCGVASVRRGPARPFAGSRARLHGPDVEPRWARLALLLIASGAAVAYGWAPGHRTLETFYAAADRSMALNWHNFFFGAFDPQATITIDKLPGAFWVQALFVRAFGFHVWAVMLPQAIEGTLAILVLYRAVRMLAGWHAGLVAALVLALDPANVGLNRGNVADSLLVLLLVCAASCASRAIRSGSAASLCLSGCFVGLAFQAKMTQAWLVLPPLAAAYLYGAPQNLWTRLRRLACAGLVTLAVSFAWMLAVSAVSPQHRPYVDGSTNDSVFSQVFAYNGLARVTGSAGPMSATGPVDPFLKAASRTNVGSSTSSIGSGPTRLLAGPFGRSDGWLLPLAAVALVGVLVGRRRSPRGDPLVASAILWGGWLVIHLVVFSASPSQLHPYYLGVLGPATGALAGLGFASVRLARARSRTLRWLISGTVLASLAYGIMLLPVDASPRWLGVAAVLVAAAALAVAGFGGTLRSALIAGLASMLVVPGVASLFLVENNLGSFSTPFQDGLATLRTEQYQAEVQTQAEYAVKRFPASTRRTSSVLFAAETSALAASYIAFTGLEVLPIGGYGGGAPVPDLATMRHQVDSGVIRTVLIAQSPPSRDPRLVWIRRHCSAPSPSVAASSLQGSLAFYTC